MAPWSLLALLAALLWALSNVWDRWLVKHIPVDWEGLVGVATFALFSTSLIFSLLLGGTFQPSYLAPALVVVGLIWLLTTFYYEALSSAKVEEAAPLLALSAVFALIIDYLMGKPPSSLQTLGVVMAMAGAFLIAWRGKVKGVVFALLAALAIALRNSVAVLFSTSLVDFIATYSAVGLLLSIPLLFLAKERGRMAPFLGPNILNGLAFALLVLSLSNGSVAVSTALSQLSALFVVLIAHVFYKAPWDYTLLKGLGALLLTAGAVLCLLPGLSPP